MNSEIGKIIWTIYKTLKKKKKSMCVGEEIFIFLVGNKFSIYKH